MTLTVNPRDAVQKLPAPVAVLFAASLSFLFLAGIGFAQSANGAGHVSAAPPTGSVHPPTGPVTPRTSSVAPPTSVHKGTTTAAGNSTHHPHHPGHRDQTSAGTAYYPYYVPYVLDNNSADSNTDDDSQYQGGPTVFDRRGSGAASYIASDPGPNSSFAANDPAQSLDPASDPPGDPQDPTTLVFKDGHQLAVENYAIVGQTLFDLTPGHPRKVPLSDLDLPATRKQNDDQGIVFQLPASVQN